MKFRIYHVSLAVFTLFFGAWFLALPRPSFAASVSECPVDSQIQAILSAQNNKELDELEAIRTELIARKDALRVLAKCLTDDVRRTREEVQKLSLSDERDKRVQGRILENLDNVLREQNLDEARINELGLRGTRDAARALKDWRARVYGQVKGQADGFALWLKSRTLIGTAENRLHNITGTLRSLDMIDKEEISRQLDSSDHNLREARERHDAAGALLE